MGQDCIVIGAGIIGLATAEALLERGASVTVLERGVAGQESSWAGGGILSPLCPWDYSEPVTQLAGYSASLFPGWVSRLQDATGMDPEYAVCGMRVFPPFEARIAAQWCAAHQMRLEMDEHSLWLPEVAQVRNPRLLSALRNRVILLGGRIVEYCAVNGIAANKSRVLSVRAETGVFHADHFIVAAGAWSREACGNLALDLAIRPVRGQMVLFKFDFPPVSCILLQGETYLIPRRDGHVLVGSTLEEAGFDKNPTPGAQKALHERAQRMLPALRDMQPLRHWAGLRPASPHNVPAIARHPHLENLYVNSGHFRYGVTMAPASAVILANELDGKPQPIETAPYRAGWSGGVA